MAGAEKYPPIASAFQMPFEHAVRPSEQPTGSDRAIPKLISLERLPHSVAFTPTSTPNIYVEIPSVATTLPELAPSESGAASAGLQWEFKLSSPLAWWHSPSKGSGQQSTERVGLAEQAPQPSLCNGRVGFCETSNEMLYRTECEEPCSSFSAQRAPAAADSSLQPGESLNEQHSPGNGTVAIEELENFARYFKKTRIRLGFTQGDVGCAMGRLYNFAFSQTTISRFEALNLSFKNMCKLKPRLEKWLADTEETLRNGTFDCKVLKTSLDTSVCPRRRKRRTNIEGRMRDILEEEFQACNRPHPSRLDQLANQLRVDREVVRVWFCNRRQKEKKECRDCLNEMEGRKCSAHACGFLVYTHDSRLPLGGSEDCLQVNDRGRNRP